ncbi:hypothetical protein ACF0H5_001932 [Mactra antiquata]
MRFPNLRERLHEELGIYGFHLTVTSKNCIRKDEDYYVTKEETRIEGPWRNENNNIPSFYRDAKLRPWQKEIVEEMGNTREDIRYSTNGRLQGRDAVYDEHIQGRQTGIHRRTTGTERQNGTPILQRDGDDKRGILIRYEIPGAMSGYQPSLCVRVLQPLSE